MAKSEQLDKLKESLCGKAKNLDPSKTDSIDRALDILKSAYGDPVVLLQFRKQGLLKLGAYPEAAVKSNPQRLVKWCLELERLIDDIIKLGDGETRLEMVAYNDDTIDSVTDLFPMRIVYRIEKIDLHGKEKLDSIVEIIEEERKVPQRMALRVNSSTKRPQRPDNQSDS